MNVFNDKKINNLPNVLKNKLSELNLKNPFFVGQMVITTNNTDFYHEHYYFVFENELNKPDLIILKIVSIDQQRHFNSIADSKFCLDKINNDSLFINEKDKLAHSNSKKHKNMLLHHQNWQAYLKSESL